MIRSRQASYLPSPSGGDAWFGWGGALATALARLVCDARTYNKTGSGQFKGVAFVFYNRDLRKIPESRVSVREAKATSAYWKSLRLEAPRGAREGFPGVWRRYPSAPRTATARPLPFFVSSPLGHGLHVFIMRVSSLAWGWGGEGRGRGRQADNHGVSSRRMVVLGGRIIITPL